MSDDIRRNGRKCFSMRFCKARRGLLPVSCLGQPEVLLGLLGADQERLSELHLHHRDALLPTLVLLLTGKELWLGLLNRAEVLSDGQNRVVVDELARLDFVPDTAVNLPLLLKGQRVPKRHRLLFSAWYDAVLFQ